jgi:hypothetical protein
MLFFDIGSTAGRVFSGAVFSGNAQAPLMSLAVPNLVFEDVTVSPPPGDPQAALVLTTF